MVHTRTGKPIHATPLLSEVSLVLSMKQFQCWSGWWWPFLVLSRKVVSRFLFLSLSSPSERWRDVFGFVPAGCVSSSLKLQIFRNTSHYCDSCFAGQRFYSVISLDSDMSRTDSDMSRTPHPQDSSKMVVEHCHRPVWASHSTFRPGMTRCG